MTSAKPKILIVLTSHDKLGDTGRPTGWYLPEFSHPYKVFSSSSADLTIASPTGGVAPLDPSSVESFKDDTYSQSFVKEQKHLWENTQKLESFLGKASDFDAIFYVGGHGPMFDLAHNETSQKLIREFYEAGKVVSAVCHGPAAITNVKLADGEYLVKGQPVTAFTNDEEDSVGLSSAMPFALETELRKNGAVFEKAEQPWGERVSIGRRGKLLTGQNPASATKLAEEVLKALTK